jgi:hypothetical protein
MATGSGISLSPREIETLNMIAPGFLELEIASGRREDGLSPDTTEKPDHLAQ